ncbi:FIST C-terminal domain-containing protein [candidate division FCPU426 bacterium]|nr:FIST C-terminal domain-containing protein [candidate division FCPU426 bacterium]
MGMQIVTVIGKDANAGSLGEKLAKEAKQQLGSHKAGLVLVFASSKYDHGALLKSLRRELGQAPLLGCTTAGEFTEKKVVKESVALAVFSECPEYQFHVAMATGLNKDAAACVQKAAAALPAQPKDMPHRTAILLHDGLAGRGEEAVLAANTILGVNVSFAGGSAGDDLAFKKTFVFCNDSIENDSVALCLIDSKNPLGIGVKHGHSPVTGNLTVTKAVDNVLYQVDGKPAWEVWKKEMAQEAKSIGIDVEQLKDPSEIGQFLIRYEMGLATATEYKVRVPLSKNDDGSLNFACTIPEGAKFKIMKSPKEDQIASAEQAAKYALKQMGGKPLAGAIIFDCVCRGIILGEEFEKGVAAISKVIGNIPLIGFETYGEICRRSGQFSGYHNTTTVAMLFPAS